MIRKHIFAHGRVQGVGFRFTVTAIAQTYNITGWVRNLYDGTVEMEAQGLEHRMELFLQELSSAVPAEMVLSALINWILRTFLL